MNVFLSNLGCKLNQAEVDRIARDFEAVGHRIVDALDRADLHIVNTCTVTRAAARDSRKTVRRRGASGRRLRTVVTGCWSQDQPAEAAALQGVDLVVPNAEKDRLLERVVGSFPEWRSATPDRPSEIPVSYTPLAFGPTRGLVKIEDGCNMGCAFCIIPSTRGRQRSRPLSAVVDEVAMMVEAGYTEVVVTGVQISAWQDRELRLADLVETILARTRVPRIRLTSIAPWDLDDSTLELFRHPRVCRHLHASLQSGSTDTLRRMRRPYSGEAFESLVERARARVPGLAVTTDVIVGFPGESDEEFRESRERCRRIGFARTHVFGYSPRPGTVAAGFGAGVAGDVRKARTREMIEIADESAQRFRAAHVGEILEVVWEERRDDDWWGMSDNYLRVRASASGPRRSSLSGAVALEERDGVLRVEPLPEMTASVGDPADAPRAARRI